MQTIAAIAKLGSLKIEVGGGIRDEARIQRYLDLGADRCILGTDVYKRQVLRRCDLQLLHGAV